MGWYRLNPNLAIYQPGDYGKINSFFWAFVYWSTDLCFWIASYIMPRIWLIYANIEPCLPPWLTLFAFPDIFPVWNVDGHPVVSAFCPRCGPAPRQIIRSRDLIFSSYVLRESLCFLNCGGQLHSVRCWQHPSVILCCIASTRIALLTHIAIWERFWMVLLTAMFTLLFVCTPLSPRPVLKQFRPGRFYPHCSKHLFHSPSLCLFLLWTQLVSYLYV